MNKVTFRKNVVVRSLAFAALSCGFAYTAAGQTILFNNGALVYTGPTAIVQVNGGFQNDGAAGVTPIFENNGTMTIANSGTPGTVFLKNGSTLQGNGTYIVEQDWINDATFTANSSTVKLNGNLQQLVTSTTGIVTTFHNLTLTGTGVGTNRKKTLQLVNANTDATGILNINDRELETQTNTMFVLNPAVAAVAFTNTFLSEGFVSSAVGGALSRATNSTSAYIFPTGSSVGTQRFRAVQLTPATASANTFTARLGNNTATVDGFNVTQLDTNMCKVTALFYHQITRSAGVDNAGIDVFYNQATDGPWDGLAQWNTPTAALWNSMGVVAQTTSATYNDNLKANWSDFSNSPYILSRAKLSDPSFVCATLCANTQGNVFTATGPGTATSYTWTTPTGTTITSGQGTNTIDVDWNATSGPITVVATDAVGCFSDPFTCTVAVSAAPTANFDTASIGFTFDFTDLSTGGATSWDWNFGDGTTSSAQNPSHDFTSTGSQTVCLTASNSNGCADTTCYVIDVDVNEYVNIPNVFTPNGDGSNDFFFINSSGLKEFHIDIYDRWGLKVFSSDAANIKWDGRTSAGVKLSDGTYFFILKAISVTTKDYSTTGYITLLKD